MKTDFPALFKEKTGIDLFQQIDFKDHILRLVRYITFLESISEYWKQRCLLLHDYINDIAPRNAQKKLKEYFDFIKTHKPPEE